MALYSNHVLRSSIKSMRGAIMVDMLTEQDTLDEARRSPSGVPSR